MLDNNGWVCKCWGCGKDYYSYDIMNNFYCDDCRKAIGIKPVNATTQVDIQDLGFGVIKETYKRDNNLETEAIKEMAENVRRAAVSIDEIWEKLDEEHPGWRERGVQQLCDKNRKLTEQNKKLKKKVGRLTNEKDLLKIALELACDKLSQFLEPNTYNPKSWLYFDFIEQAKESIDGKQDN